MRNIINIYIGLLLALPLIAGAQQSEGRKCSTFDRFLPGVRQAIDAKVAFAAVRPVRQTSILSASKRFRIHYDTSGADMPAMVTETGQRIAGSARVFVDSVAAIFDSVWNAEVTTFGFAAPASDKGEGGGNEFDVYIFDRGANDFGETQWDETMPASGTTGAPRYPAFICIDNDFGQGFRTIGIDGVKSVAAHEFYHAIQVGGYGWRGDDIYFYELTAEAMEPTVFATSKDYIFDIGTYFRNIENISLYSPYSSSFRGYERAIWGIFLMKRYGVGIMREMWESVSVMKPIVAMKTVLEKNGTSLAKEFAEFCYWNYFTGARGDSVKYYADANRFPSVNIRDRQTSGSTSLVFQNKCKGFGVNYLQAVAADTTSFIIANVNMDDALGTQANTYAYQLRASPATTDGSVPPVTGWQTDFTVTDPLNWKFTAVVKSPPLQAGPVIGYPNPFHPAQQGKFYIGPIDPVSARQNPRLSVFSASYDCVFAEDVDVETSTGSTYAVWHGKNSHGDMVASGVYIYMLSAGTTVVKGKIAVVR